MKDGERRQLAYASRRAGVPLPEVEPGDRVRVLCDGGSRGNPGPAAVAAVVVGADGTELARRALRIGRATAAEAEYRAILLGLELAAGVDEIEVRSDSRLAIDRLRAGEGPSDVVEAARRLRRRALGVAPARGHRGRRRARAQPALARVIGRPRSRAPRVGDADDRALLEPLGTPP